MFKIFLKKKSGTIISEIKERLYVPRPLRQWMIQRHPGISKTVELFSRNYYFPGMRKEVERYISKCPDGQLNKHSTHASYGYIQYTKIADYLWQNISMDFIVKFSKSEDISTGIKYNNILIIVNKLIKYAYIILYMKIFEIRQIAWIILDKIIRYYKISESIISDRDKIFISKF